MSYNVDTFKLKKVRLVLPLNIKFDKYANWLGEEGATANLANATWVVNENGEGFEMHGKVTKQGLEVTDVKCWGEGSGHAYNDVLIPLFKDHKGDLEAVCIWEGGDSITKLSIKNGVVTESSIDL